MESDFQKLVNKLERKMKSGNSVPVKDVRLQTLELRTILDALYSFNVADKQEIDHE